MRYDGGIRIAEHSKGPRWAIGYGEEGTFPDVGVLDGSEEKLRELFLFLILGAKGELSIEAMAHVVRKRLAQYG